MLKNQSHKKSPLTRFRNFLKILGPGLVTGASDDDPSGITTYSQAGASFGLATLWTALITYPMMAAIQGMCARIGLVTKTGLTGTIKKHYPKSILYIMIVLSFPAITLNIGANIQAMGAVANLLIPQVPVFAFSIFFTGALLFFTIKYSYQKIAAVLKFLCIVLVLYLVIPFLVVQDWGAVFKHTLIPTIRFDKNFISILVAILGTTISPYLFFWQASMEAEDINHKNVMVGKRMLDDMKEDVNIGMLFSTVVMFSIILAAAAVLHANGLTQIDTLEEAAKALEPLAGHLTYLLFAVGVIGTGFLSIPVLGASLSYIMAETFNWEEGLDKKFYEAKGFYLTMIVSTVIGLLLNFAGVSPVQSLIYTAILYGLTAPVLIAIVLHIGNNKKIMHQFTNPFWSNFLGFLTLIVMTLAAGVLIYFQFQ